MGTIILTLSRNMTRIVWVNIIFLTILVLFVFLLFATLESQKALAVASLGILAGAGNHLYLNVFKLRKVSRDLLSSFAKIETELFLDDLTGFWNRGPGMKRLEKEAVLAGQNGGGLSVALLDIENFKLINDTYGHCAGDSILKEIARNIRDEVRKSDFVIRYGGEEFLVVMPQTDDKEVLRPLDRWRKRFSRLGVGYRDRKIMISLTMGAASLRGETEDIPSLLSRADRALLAAKISERSRIPVRQPTLFWRMTSLN
jgi:diguanylate cyclase (GGDEF)-like protein